MKTSELADFSDLLLKLYRQSAELPIDRFQDAVLGLVKPLVPFDSSMWGTATMTPVGVDIHTIHLHRTSQEMLDAYEPYKAHDKAAAAVASRRSATGGFQGTAPQAFSDPALRDFMRRFGHENLFITGQTDPGTHFLHWISLFRADADAHCLEDERRLVACLQPHLMQALSMNRAIHLERLVLPHAERLPRGAAIADLRGVLYHATPHFDALLSAEWPGRPTGALPPALLDALMTGEQRFLGRTLVVQRHVEYRLLFLKARARCRADALTPREAAVAQLVAEGQTHKQIAQQLARAPATVRNQIQAVYAKLEVSNIAGLTKAMRWAD